MGRFVEDISNSSLTDAKYAENGTDLTPCMMNLLSMLYQHAPLKMRIVTLRPAAPWYTEKIKA